MTLGSLPELWSVHASIGYRSSEISREEAGVKLLLKSQVYTRSSTFTSLWMKQEVIWKVGPSGVPPTPKLPHLARKSPKTPIESCRQSAFFPAINFTHPRPKLIIWWELRRQLRSSTAVFRLLTVVTLREKFTTLGDLTRNLVWMDTFEIFSWYYWKFSYFCQKSWVTIENIFEKNYNSSFVIIVIVIVIPVNIMYSLIISWKKFLWIVKYV